MPCKVLVCPNYQLPVIPSWTPVIQDVRSNRCTYIKTGGPFQCEFFHANFNANSSQQTRTVIVSRSVHACCDHALGWVCYGSNRREWLWCGLTLADNHILLFSRLVLVFGSIWIILAVSRWIGETLKAVRDNREVQTGTCVYHVCRVFL